MKRKEIIFIFIIFVAHIVQAQQKVEIRRGAIITFNTCLYDYDTVLRGSHKTACFYFSNTGDEPLIINSVTSSCGCTTPTWSKKPIMPGHKGAITVNYNTSDIGTFRKTLVVHSNATNKEKYVLRIKGVVLPKMSTQ